MVTTFRHVTLSRSLITFTDQLEVQKGICAIQEAVSGLYCHLHVFI